MTPQLAHAAGHHWPSIDTEHRAFAVDEVAQYCTAALPTRITPIVHVRAQALNNGVLTFRYPNEGLKLELR